jgi:hypothetical protein
VKYFVRLCFLAFAASWTLHAQEPAAPAPTQPQITFAFEHPGVPVPRFTLRINQDGTGAYTGEQLASAPRNAPAPPVPEPFDRTLTLSRATTTKIFTLAHDLHFFNISCASKAKNIADTGTKILTYTAPDGGGSCTYNYSDDKNIQTLTDLVFGIAETMDEGRHLDFLRRFDRLGLDDAMAFLAGQAASGRALEIGTIAPSLRLIANDPALLQRVRGRATALLATVAEPSR